MSGVFVKSPPCSPGLYGKVPIRGDFVSRRLSAAFIRPWDDWLQEALSASRERLGSAWLDFYLISPIWRFVLSPGSCGSEAWAGILMPSVDKVNRHFPLTLAAPIKQQEILPRLFSERSDWFDKLEELALLVLDDKLDLEALDRELQETVLMPFLAVNDGQRGAQRIGSKESRPAFQIEMGAMSNVRDAFVHLSSCMLSEFMPVYSLWCTKGSQWVNPALIAYDGLPPAAVYAELLTGRRQQDDWDGWLASRLSLLRSDREAAARPREPASATGVARTSWRSNASSTVGCVRKVNEDSFLECGKIGLWVVADGMGGHVGGDVASRAVVSALSSIKAAESLEAMIESVKASLQDVNGYLIEKAKDYGIGQTMGSTVVVMVAVGNRCAALWLGDSRLYRYRKGVLEQITSDHSLAAELSRMGGGSREVSANSRINNMLTKALGVSTDLEIDTIAYEACEGDIYLLCSDGMIREVGDGEIGEILGTAKFEDSSKKLIDLALERGARDNVTAIVVGNGFSGSND